MVFLQLLGDMVAVEYSFHIRIVAFEVVVELEEAEVLLRQKLEACH